MATIAGEQLCRFRWHIFNPFVPWRRMVSSFYLGSTTLTEWKVTLEPDSRTLEFWNFRFSLTGMKPGSPYDDIITRRLEVNVSINGKLMNQNVKEYYIFRRSNWHTYGFTAYANTAPLRDAPHHLIIAVDITFPTRDVAIPRSGIAADMIQLSVDMAKLFDAGSDSNMTLNSTDPLWSFNVHSYILDVRWTNFRTVHPAIDDNAVDMNISPNVLWEILKYMYSGQLEVGGQNWGDLALVTEFFQVMERYRIHHLYKVFATDETYQVRNTNQNLTIRVANFRLDDNNGRAIPVLGYRWEFNVDADGAGNANGRIDNMEDLNPDDYASDDYSDELPDDDQEENPGENRDEIPDENREDIPDEENVMNAERFVFRIKFMLFANNSYFQYWMKSKCPRRMHVQVNLEFKIRLLDRRRLDVFPVHQRDFTIRPYGTARSGTCNFEGQTDRLRRFIEGRLQRTRRRQYYIRCVLHLSDGTSVSYIMNENNAMLDGLERYRILSDDMFGLIHPQPIGNDFTVMCRDEFPADEKNPDYSSFDLHKCIFEARVPEWRAVLGDVVEGDNYPDSVILDVIRDIFQPIHVYIYTGKLSYIIERHLDQVEEFAQRAGLPLVLNLVNIIREYYQNQQPF